MAAGLKDELGLDKVDLVGGDGRDDVNEGVDCGSMLGMRLNTNSSEQDIQDPVTIRKIKNATSFWAYVHRLGISLDHVIDILVLHGVVNKLVIAPKGRFPELSLGDHPAGNRLTCHRFPVPSAQGGEHESDGGGVGSGDHRPD
jgi:hypothetical protein